SCGFLLAPDWRIPADRARVRSSPRPGTDRRGSATAVAPSPATPRSPEFLPCPVFHTNTAGQTARTGRLLPVAPDPAAPARTTGAVDGQPPGPNARRSRPDRTTRRVPGSPERDPR